MRAYSFSICECAQNGNGAEERIRERDTHNAMHREHRDVCILYTRRNRKNGKKKNRLLCVWLRATSALFLWKKKKKLKIGYENEYIYFCLMLTFVSFDSIEDYAFCFFSLRLSFISNNGKRTQRKKDSSTAGSIRSVHAESAESAFADWQWTVNEGTGAYKDCECEYWREEKKSSG